nr:MAG TPA: hypothetical protein [Caudoviricetes sp.]
MPLRIQSGEVPHVFHPQRQPAQGQRLCVSARPAVPARVRLLRHLLHLRPAGGQIPAMARPVVQDRGRDHTGGARRQPAGLGQRGPGAQLVQPGQGHAHTRMGARRSRATARPQPHDGDGIDDNDKRRISIVEPSCGHVDAVDDQRRLVDPTGGDPSRPSDPTLGGSRDISPVESIRLNPITLKRGET